MGVPAPFSRLSQDPEREHLLPSTEHWKLPAVSLRPHSTHDCFPRLMLAIQSKAWESHGRNLSYSFWLLIVTSRHRGWTRSISHRFETMAETITLVGIFWGILRSQGFLGGAGFRPSTVLDVLGGSSSFGGTFF